MSLWFWNFYLQNFVKYFENFKEIYSKQLFIWNNAVLVKMKYCFKLKCEKSDVDYFLNSFLHLHEQNHSSENQANTKFEIVQKWLISVESETHVL